MELVIDIIVKLIAGLFVTYAAYLLPKVKTYLNTKLSNEQSAQLYSIISTFVGAAEQLYRTEDKSGELKKQYVQTQLEELGIALSAEINAKIEAAVFEMNSNIVKSLSNKEESEE